MPSAANIDFGTIENSYSPTASLMSISERAFQTIIIRARRGRSSFSSIMLSLATTRRVFPVLFHVRSLRFFIGDQMLCLHDWILSFTKLPYNSFPMALCWHISLFTSLGMTTFIPRLKRSELSSKNGFVEPRW